MPRTICLPVLVLVSLARSAAAADPPVAYPEAYREWTHVKSMVIPATGHALSSSFAGIHHVYVNQQGLTALRAGTTFPAGTVLIFDLLEANADAGATVEGTRKFIAVMTKGKTTYGATGGWGFEAFKGDSRTERVVKDANAECFACHQSQAAHDFVFSRWRK